MKLRILPLILALALALAGCAGTSHPDGPADPTPEGTIAATATPVPDITDAPESALPSPEPAPTPEATPVSDPTETPLEGTLAPAYTHHPDEHHTATPAPVVTHHPDEHHSAAPSAAPASPTPAPSATPEPTPEPVAAVTAQSLYEAAMSGAGLKVADFVDNSDYMTAFYTTMDTANLEEFIYCSVGMSATNQEFFIAKVKSGKADAVKSACQDRLQGMKEEMETYPDSGLYVDSYQLVTKGDWLMFCVCPDAAKAVEAFKNGIK